MTKSRKGLSGVEGGKSILLPVECLQGDRCSFWHESNDRAQEPEHTAATPSEAALSRGRSVSKKRSIRGKSNYGYIVRQPVRARERLVNIGIRRVPILF